MSLFDIIPGRFFSVLVSGNRELYAEALLLLYKMFKNDLNIRLDDYLSSLISLLDDKIYLPEADEDEKVNSLSTRDKARLIVDRFVKTGWIEKEFIDGSFIEIITPKSYAIQVMKLLSELENNDIHEYNSLVFATYSGLKQAENEHEAQMYEAVLSAKANTEQLEERLRMLYHGIRNFLHSIQDNNNVNLLLKNHFKEYKNLSDRIYHPIKTMDSIHRYSMPIKNILGSVLETESLVQSMCARAMTIKRYKDLEAAEQDIIKDIDYIIERYQAIGTIINEIDRKHSTYTKSSIEKIQYLMTADQTIKGKLVELLNAYSQADAGQRVVLGTMLEKKIRINRQEFIDGKSLYCKNIKNRRLDTPPMRVEQDKSFSETAMADMLQQMKKLYPKTRIKKYIDNLFTENRQVVGSAEIPLNNDEDFILFMLAVISANDREMDYNVELREGRIINNGYSIPELNITKKEAKESVE